MWRNSRGELLQLFYLLAIAASFAQQWISGALYVLVSLIWLVPGRRVEWTPTYQATTATGAGGSSASE